MKAIITGQKNNPKVMMLHTKLTNGGFTVEYDNANLDKYNEVMVKINNKIMTYKEAMVFIKGV